MARWKVGALAAAVALVVAACNVPFDYDNDGRADVVWETNNGDWYRDGTTAPIFTPGGTPSGLDVPGDYDGNHVWEPATIRDHAQWVTAGGRGTFTFAAPPNPTTTPGAGFSPPQVIPVPADYDGDGKTDAAWYRESDATWWIETEPGPIQFGIPWGASASPNGYDVPVPADYDGDRKADLATYDPDAAHFTIRGVAAPIPVGLPYGFPAVADYDGDGKADPAVLHSVGVPPADLPGGIHPGWFIAGRPSIPADLVVSDGAFYPLPADHVAPSGAEPALAAQGTTGTWQIHVQGQPPVAVPADAGPVVPAASRFAMIRLNVGLRCYYGPQNCS